MVASVCVYADPLLPTTLGDGVKNHFFFNWMSPVQRKSNFMQVKELYSNLDNTRKARVRQYLGAEKKSKGESLRCGDISVGISLNPC